MSSDDRTDGYGDPGTRRRILNATMEHVVRDGAAVSLAAIARTAGVSRQALYLHFEDRTGLLLGLVRDMDESLDLETRIAHVLAATDAHDLLRRTVELHGWFSAAIDAVAIVLEGAEHHDPALRSAWRDRLRFRHGVHRMLVERLVEMEALSAEWTPEEATDLLYTVTLPATWRELTRELAWTHEQYVDRTTTALARLLLDRT